MNKERAYDLVIGTAALLVAVACLLVPLAAGATTSPPKPHPTTQAPTQTQTQQASAATGSIDLSLMNNPVAGDVSVRGGNSYSLVSGAAPLPPGLCPKGESVSVLFGFFAWSKTATEHECLDKVLAYAREAIPKPPVTNYITNHYTTAPAAPVATPTEPPKCEAPPAKKPAKPRKAAPAKCDVK